MDDLTPQARADRLLGVYTAARAANDKDDVLRAAEFLLAHLELHGIVPTAWTKPLPETVTPAQSDLYAASLAPPPGTHAVCRQFTVTCRLHEGRWVIDPGCLYGDGLDLDGVAQHAHDCPCGDQGGYAGREDVEAAQSLPAPTPTQLAQSIHHAYDIVTAPAA